MCEVSYKSTLARNISRDGLYICRRSAPSASAPSAPESRIGPTPAARLFLLQHCGPIQQQCYGFGRCCRHVNKEPLAIGGHVPTESLQVAHIMADLSHRYLEQGSRYAGLECRA